MHNDRFGSASFSPSRRDLLRLAVLVPAACAVGMLPGCAKPPRFDGSFIQPWRSHLDLSAQDWQQHMALDEQWRSSSTQDLLSRNRCLEQGGIQGLYLREW
jgi:hypothetical protein